MRRTAAVAVVLTLTLTSPLTAQAPAPVGPPNSWLFGAWVGGIFPPPVTLGAQECLAQPMVIFTRDVVMRAVLTSPVYVQRLVDTASAADNGFEVGFHGSYREIVANELIVSTEVYEGLPDGVTEEEAATVNTTTFTETDGRTTLTILVQAGSKTSRDAIIASGMEAGLQDALDLLDQVAVSLR